MARWVSSRARVMPTWATARLARSDMTVQQTPWGGGGADRHALGGVHGARVPQDEVLAQVLTVEDYAGLISEPPGGEATPDRVEADHRPSDSRCAPGQSDHSGGAVRPVGR